MCQILSLIKDTFFQRLEYSTGTQVSKGQLNQVNTQAYQWYILVDTVLIPIVCVWRYLLLSSLPLT